MSVVTDIILATGIDDGQLDGQDHPNVDRLNAHIREEYVFQGESLIKVDQYAKGGKAMQCDVFVAAINYLRHEEFVSAFRAIPWEAPSQVQLMLKGEEDDVFTVYLVDPTSSTGT